MTMTKKEVFDIMASDMKLWDAAKTDKHADGSISKTLDLPFGIGPHTVTLEGLTDAQKKRDAVTTFASYIRGLIKERIDDEAVTARAKASAARREQTDSGDSVSGSPEGVPSSVIETPPISGTGETYQTDAQGDGDFGATLTARRTAIVGRIKRVEDNLAQWKRELRGLDAALAAMEDDDDVESTERIHTGEA